MFKYKFSAPMPYTKSYIDKLANINNLVEKSRITSLYANLPSNCNMFSGFEQTRNNYKEKVKFDYWKELFSYSLEKDFDFIYLLNSPLPFNLKHSSFYQQLEKLDKLLKEFRNIGINKLRVANPQLMSYLGKNYSDFIIYASTSLDYKTISEYQNLILMHKEIKQIIPSHDINKNFTLLRNIKQNYPNLNIELMVNEACMKGCPHRSIHEMIDTDFHIIYKNEICLSNAYCSSCCSYIFRKYPFYSLTLNNNIYPWEINEYFKLGITNFKLVGRDLYTDKIQYYLKIYLDYLKAIDNHYKVEDISIATFLHHLLSCSELKELTTKEIRHLLPKIEHFKKYGHLCASRCGVECRYCYKCAEKIQKVFEKKQQEQRKRNIPVCCIK